MTHGKLNKTDSQSKVMQTSIRWRSAVRYFLLSFTMNMYHPRFIFCLTYSMFYFSVLTNDHYKCIINKYDKSCLCQ